MGLAFARWARALHAIAIALSVYVAARAVNTIAADAIAPAPVWHESKDPPQKAPTAERVALDAEKVARLFEVPLPTMSARSTSSPEPGRIWNRIPIRSSLNGSLIGTAVTDPPRFSLCQITNPDLKETQVYAIGDAYQSARIYRIEKERILLDRDGINEYIDVADAAPPIPASPIEHGGGVRRISETEYVVARSELNGAITHLPELGTTARIVPSFSSGVPNGFKLFAIVPNSLYARLGLQNGDVIRRINGYEMNPQNVLELLQKLRDLTRFEIEIERRGAVLRNSYSIE